MTIKACTVVWGKFAPTTVNVFQYVDMFITSVTAP